MKQTMKILKIAVIAIIAAASFSTAQAQVVVKARIGGPTVVRHEPVRVVRRPVHRRVYHPRRRVIVRQPVHHRRPRPVIVRRHH